MNIVQGSHKEPVFMFPLSLIGQRFLLPAVQVRGLLPFFRVGINIRVILLKLFIKPFSFQILHIFLHATHIAVTSYSVLIKKKSRLLYVFSGRQPVLQPASQSLCAQSAGNGCKSGHHVL